MINVFYEVNFMKKRNILLSVLGFAALATLASCGGKENPTKKDNTTSGC